MFEHPYLAYKVTEFDQEQLERAVERRRFIAEHRDQIVPRPAGPIRRMLQRMTRGADRSRSARSDAEGVAGRRTPVVCEPATSR